jgi:hypothetical protein
MKRRMLFALKPENPHEKSVRFLLLNSVDGAHNTILSEMTNGIETEMDTGTEYEMNKKAEEIAQLSAASGFRIANDERPVFESLKNTVALAIVCGHTSLYDNRFKTGTNFTGSVPLSKWPGMTAKNGGDYEYALDGIKILARPTLPPNHGLNMKPQTSKETLEVFMKAAKLKQTVGPDAEFVLCD